MPSREREIAQIFTGFLGTNISVDPASLPPEVLQRSTNWVPSLQAFTLTRRFGAVPFQTQIAAEDVMVAIRFTHQGHRYLYIVTRILGAGDFLAVSLDDGPFTAVTNGMFAAAGGQDYGLTRYGNFLYASNSQDPIKKVSIGGAAVDLVPLATFVDTSAAAVVVEDPGSRLQTGGYAYVWAVYDASLSRWVARGSAARTVEINDIGDRALTIQLPEGYVLQSDQSFHLFVAPVLLPIEYGHDQTPNGADSTVTLREIIVDQTPTPLVGGITRKGNILVPHKGRIFIAGSQDSVDTQRRVYATNVIVPGLEQIIFDQGDFYPANAVLQLPVGPITAMGVASLTGTQRSPSSPLAIFTATQTWLLFGDILDDPNADLVQRSDRIGSTSPHATINTPYGLMFPSLESIYLLTPDGQMQNVGWPISNAIRRIPPNRRHRIVACYHDGFYKIWFSPAGRTENVERWDLDLRRGLGSIPSWWGPHRIENTDAAPEAVCVGVEESTKLERRFGLSQHGISHEEAGTTDLGQAFNAILRTGLITLDAPFDSKLGTRIRIIAKPSQDTSVTAKLVVDDGLVLANFGDMDLIVDGGIWFEGNPGPTFEDSTWCAPSTEPNCASWAVAAFQEGEAIAEDDRPRGQSFAVQLEHAHPQQVELRHMEFRQLPRPRVPRE